MSNIDAKIITDSINAETNKRITSMLLKYPRMIHSELMTHRVFSRNAASSRAIPFAKMMERVKTSPAMPVWWGLNEPGMQANAEVTNVEEVERAWLKIRDMVVVEATSLFDTHKLHKQIINRLTEPWMMIETLVTSTEWENFFSLRAHPDAMPEFVALADRMLWRYAEPECPPAMVQGGSWHLPFGDRMDPAWDMNTSLRVSVARCARLSYLTFDNKIDLEEDLKLHDRLKNAGHWSPFEHPAQAARMPTHSGNFRDWKQYRKQFPSENRTVDLKSLLAERRAAGSKFAGPNPSLQTNETNQ